MEINEKNDIVASASATSQTKEEGTAEMEVPPYVLPPAPVPPAASDCCGSGCVPCVMDIYDQEVVMWKRECDRIKRGESKDTKHGPVLSTDQYTEFPIEDIKQESTDSWQYRFTVPGAQQIPLAVGQHLIMRWRGIVTRQYTPVLSDDGFFDVVIKVYPNGTMSKYVSDWKIGDVVEWRGPCGELSYRQNQYERILLLAAGTGIAPMVPLIRHIVTNDKEDTIICLLYTCRTYQDILCKDTLKEFAEYWNFSVIYFLTGGGTDDEKEKIHHGDNLRQGRICNSVLEQYKTHDKVFICGTREFDTAMIDLCKEIGFRQEQLHKF